MCLGIPYQVLEVEDRDSCFVRIGSGAQRCFTGLIDPVAPGDWLLVHAGFALHRIAPEDARVNLDLLRQALVAPAAIRGSDDGVGEEPAEDA